MSDTNDDVGQQQEREPTPRERLIAEGVLRGPAIPPPEPTPREQQLEQQLSDARREAAGYRIGNKGQLAEFTRGLAEMAGMDADPKRLPDAATLIAKLQERDYKRVAEVRDAKVREALAERFHKTGVDYGSTALIRAALSESGVLKKLDPTADDFIDTLDSHIEELLDVHPNLKRQSNVYVPSRGGTELTGGAGIPSQLTHTDLGAMTPEEIVAARKAGRLDAIMGRRG
jgi:hypothetical protein